MRNGEEGGLEPTGSSEALLDVIFVAMIWTFIFGGGEGSSFLI